MSGQAYVQEACLGRVRTKKGKKTILYLIKWQDYDKLADITCEPPDNVLVQRVEEPLLDQASEDFRKDLAALLKKYLESHPSTKSPVKAPKRRIVADDDAEDAAEPAPKKKPAPSAGASKVPAGGAAVDKWPALLGGASCPLAPDVERTGDRYTVTKYRQFVLLPPTEEDGKDWVGVFMKVQVAKLNPGLVFSHPKCLLGPAPPDSLTPPLYGSVDGASRDGGVGWFFHHESGVSIDGIRCAKSDQVPAFVEGDTVGLVVDLRAARWSLPLGAAEAKGCGSPCTCASGTWWRSSRTAARSRSTPGTTTSLSSPARLAPLCPDANPELSHLRPFRTSPHPGPSKLHCFAVPNTAFFPMLVSLN
eukprot:EG_transcript_15523